VPVDNSNQHKLPTVVLGAGKVLKYSRSWPGEKAFVYAKDRKVKAQIQVPSGAETPVEEVRVMFGAAMGVEVLVEGEVQR